jgi:hypothetical protein
MALLKCGRGAPRTPTLLSLLAQKYTK